MCDCNAQSFLVHLFICPEIHVKPDNKCCPPSGVSGSIPCYCRFHMSQRLQRSSVTIMSTTAICGCSDILVCVRSFTFLETSIVSVSSNLHRSHVPSSMAHRVTYFWLPPCYRIVRYTLVSISPIGEGRSFVTCVTGGGTYCDSFSLVVDLIVLSGSMTEGSSYQTNGSSRTSSIYCSTSSVVLSCCSSYMCHRR
jgi:hypothetical protein